MPQVTIKRLASGTVRSWAFTDAELLLSSTHYRPHFKLIENFSAKYSFIVVNELSTAETLIYLTPNSGFYRVACLLPNAYYILVTFNPATVWTYSSPKSTLLPSNVLLVNQINGCKQIKYLLCTAAKTVFPYVIWIRSKHQSPGDNSNRSDFTKRCPNLWHFTAKYNTRTPNRNEPTAA